MKQRLSVLLIAVLIGAVGSVGVAAAVGGDGHRGPGGGAGWERAVRQFQPASPSTSVVGSKAVRVWGADRYETAVAISQAAWDPEYTGIVFLATGANFPDALAAGPSTVYDGPVLLVQQTALPPATAAEIDRLDPCYVVAFGGPEAISDTVIAAAGAYADPGQAKCDPEASTTTSSTEPPG
jgi:putative cell wall-binding protein